MAKMSAPKWGWTFHDPADFRAVGPFDSYDEAMTDAYATLRGSGAVVARIQIDHMFRPDFLSYFPDADDVAEQASECFLGDHGSCDEHVFEVGGDNREATKELVEAVRAWSEKWVSNNIDWWMDGRSEEVRIRVDDADPRNKEPKDAE